MIRPTIGEESVLLIIYYCGGGGTSKKKTMARRDSCDGTCGTSFRAKRWLSLNGCGISCVTLSFGLHVFALITLGLHFLGGSTAAIAVYCTLYVPAFVLAVASLYTAWTTDPGAVPMGAMPLYHPSFGETGEVSAASAARDGKAAAAAATGEDLESGLARAVMGTAAGAAAAAVSNAVGGDDSPSIPVEEGLKQRSIGGSSSHNNRAADPGAATTAASTPRPGGNGGMTSPSASSSRGVRRCRKCNDNYKPPRAHHDSVTGRCVVKLDHYCPWVGNAVGALNHKFFCLFVFYTFLTSLISGALIIMTFARCGAFMAAASFGDGDDDASSASSQQQRTAAVPEWCPYGPGRGYSVPFLILLPVTFLFLVFTFCMLVEQIVAITKNTSKIARMKMRSGQGDVDELGRVATDFNEMFGGDGTRVAWHWFVPTPVRFPSEEGRDAVLGYRYDPSICGDGPWRAANNNNVAGTTTTTTGAGTLAPLSVGSATANGDGGDASSKGAVASALEKVASSTSPVNNLLNRRSNSPATKIPYSRLENQDDGGGLT